MRVTVCASSKDGAHRCNVEEGAHFRVDNAVPHESIDAQLARLQLDSTDQDASLVFRDRESVVELVEARITLLRFTQEHFQDRLAN